jgi:hypothetical protein
MLIIIAGGLTKGFYHCALDIYHNGPCHLHFKTTTFDDKKSHFTRQL